jgi:hypothetical protein
LSTKMLLPFPNFFDPSYVTSFNRRSVVLASITTIALLAMILTYYPLFFHCPTIIRCFFSILPSFSIV